MGGVNNNGLVKKCETRFRDFVKTIKNVTFFALKGNIARENLTFCDSDLPKSSRNDSLEQVLAHVRFLMISFPNVSFS